MAVKPDDATAASQLAHLLIQAKQYSEVPAILEKPIASSPDNYHLQVALGGVSALRPGKEGLSEAKKVAGATSDPMILNDLAYYPADTDSSLDLAAEWAPKAGAATEQSSADENLNSFTSREIRAANSLAHLWDTLGWVDFKKNNLPAAEEYLGAAWHLSQGNTEANHLGQVYEKQGKHAAAIHMRRLAIALDSVDENSRERLRKTGAAVADKTHRFRLWRNSDRCARSKFPPCPSKLAALSFIS